MPDKLKTEIEYLISSSKYYFLNDIFIEKDGKYITKKPCEFIELNFTIN